MYILSSLNHAQNDVIMHIKWSSYLEYTAIIRFMFVAYIILWYLHYSICLPLNMPAALIWTIIGIYYWNQSMNIYHLDEYLCIHLRAYVLMINNQWIFAWINILLFGKIINNLCYFYNKILNIKQLRICNVLDLVTNVPILVLSSQFINHFKSFYRNVQNEMCAQSFHNY